MQIFRASHPKMLGIMHISWVHSGIISFVSAAVSSRILAGAARSGGDVAGAAEAGHVGAATPRGVCGRDSGLAVVLLGL
jgi:hypothetical protein